MFRLYKAQVTGRLPLVICILLPLLLSACSGGNSSGTALTAPGKQLNASAPSASAPGAPASVVAAAGSGEVTLTWAPVTGASSYNIYYLTHAGVAVHNAKQLTPATADLTLAASAASMSYQVSGLTNSATYYFRVTAVNAAGEESAVSSEVSATPMRYMPGKPQIFAITGGFSQATLNWQDVPYATSYNVYYSTSPGVAPGGATAIKKSTHLTSLTETGLMSAPGHYYFVVTAVNSTGEGAASTEVAFVAKSAYKSVTAGNGFSAALTIMEPSLDLSGSVWEWGDNSSGQFGTGNQSGGSNPKVAGTDSVIQMAAGANNMVALKANSITTWGDNARGQIGNLGFAPNGTGSQRSLSPKTATLSASTVMTAVAAGSKHDVALKNDGSVWTWGDNVYGQLGYSSIDCTQYGSSDVAGYYCYHAPTQVKINGSVTAIAAGAQHTLAVVKSTGTVWSWGRNESRQLGSPEVACTNVIALSPLKDPADPTKLLSDSACNTFPIETYSLGATPIAVAAGDYHSVALTSDGRVFTWGGNNDGQLGASDVPMDTTQCTIMAGTPFDCRKMPGEVKNLNNVIAIASGAFHNLALTSDGRVWAWGKNNYGQLGNNSLNFSAAPVQVLTSAGLPLDGIIAIAAGAYHSVALRNNGTVWAWGNNDHGQLGNGASGGYSIIAVQLSSDSNGLANPVAVLPGM